MLLGSELPTGMFRQVLVELGFSGILLVAISLLSPSARLILAVPVFFLVAVVSYQRLNKQNIRLPS